MVEAGRGLRRSRLRGGRDQRLDDASHQGPPPDRQRLSAGGVGGWVGLALGLINVYPTLFPWSTSVNKGVGILLCVLCTATVARSAVLFSRFELDWILVVLVGAIIVVLASLLLATYSA